MKFIFFVLIIVDIVFARHCSAPVYPVCLNVSYGMVDSYRQIYGLTCESFLKNYLYELESYNECITGNINEAYSNAIKAYNCIYTGQCN
ncbi:hypothetical protein CIG2463D_0324 [Campylobacter iguaniorum]|uniref:hypothetical protein n=1 Tax=Campylobacter iguaniorum TaxID=1244531 RepID=UPI000739FC1E|nr:hypothetical protein [Campylobacter iguaniorum]ALV23929.1 hypothetical protein CIG2463D_0324 [Campylobacter iguaniorum]